MKPEPKFLLNYFQHLFHKKLEIADFQRIQHHSWRQKSEQALNERPAGHVHGDARRGLGVAEYAAR